MCSGAPRWQHMSSRAAARPCRSRNSTTGSLQMRRASGVAPISSAQAATYQALRMNMALPPCRAIFARVHRRGTLRKPRSVLLRADARFSELAGLIRRAICFQLNAADTIVENAELRRSRLRHIDDAAVAERTSAADPHRDGFAGFERGDLDQGAKRQRPVRRDQLARRSSPPAAGAVPGGGAFTDDAGLLRRYPRPTPMPGTALALAGSCRRPSPTLRPRLPIFCALQKASPKPRQDHGTIRAPSKPHEEMKRG